MEPPVKTLGTIRPFFYAQKFEHKKTPSEDEVPIGGPRGLRLPRPARFVKKTTTCLG